MEKKDPDVCCVGRVCVVSGGKVSLLGIDPHAKWEGTPADYRVKQITRINFGDDYEQALHIVGGSATG